MAWKIQGITNKCIWAVEELGQIAYKNRKLHARNRNEM